MNVGAIVQLHRQAVGFRFDKPMAASINECGQAGCRGGKMSDKLVIHHDRAALRFETIVDGHRAYLAYVDLGQQTLDMYRTFVPDALRGKGIAAALTQHALDYARREGYVVIPSCSYVERYIERQSAAAGGEEDQE